MRDRDKMREKAQQVRDRERGMEAWFNHKRSTIICKNERKNTFSFRDIRFASKHRIPVKKVNQEKIPQAA
jgi:hypothetical protein